MNGTTIMFEALSPDQLAHAQGGTTCDLSGVPAAGRSIIMAESGGESTAKNPHSTAFGLGSSRSRIVAR